MVAFNSHFAAPPFDPHTHVSHGALPQCPNVGVAARSRCRGIWVGVVGDTTCSPMSWHIPSTPKRKAQMSGMPACAVGRGTQHHPDYIIGHFGTHIGGGGRTHWMAHPIQVAVLRRWIPRPPVVRHPPACAHDGCQRVSTNAVTCQRVPTCAGARDGGILWGRLVVAYFGWSFNLPACCRHRRP